MDDTSTTITNPQPHTPMRKMEKRMQVVILALTALVGVSVANGESWHVDFQGNTLHNGLYGQTDPIDHLDYNIFEVQSVNVVGGSAYTAGPMSLALLDSLGRAGSVVLTVDNAGSHLLGWSGSNADGLHGDCLLALSAGGDSYFGLPGATGTLSYSITGLSINTPYDLTFLHSTVAGRGIDFTANGETTSVSGAVPSSTITVMSDASGVISGTGVYTGAEGNWAGLEIRTLVAARQELGLASALENPWAGDIQFIMGAYGLDDRTTEADTKVIEMRDDFRANNYANFHWTGYQLERIYWLYSSQSTIYPGRMSIAAETAVLEMLWEWASAECVIGMADPAYVNYIWGSENHHLQAWGSYWGAAQIFAAHPIYSTYTYADSSTPAQMAAEFNEYFKAWLRDRSSKNPLMEVASPIYARYSLNCLFNLADFAADSELKAAASSYLDIYFAEWALEQIDGVRGGSRHRCYPGQYSNTHPGAGAEHAWYLFGLGGGLNTHPGVLSALTTFWRPSPATVGLALDTVGRGSYSYTSRPLGLHDQAGGVNPPVYGGYALDPDAGSLLRTTWCTPDFVMGMSQMEARDASEWTLISAQNRWNGVIVGGHSTARIFTQRPDPASGSVYNEEWGVQHEGAMILQHLTRATRSTAQQIFFDPSLTLVETSGWIFAEAPSAYTAVKVVDGSWNWNGVWAVLTNMYSPIILETGRKQDYADMAAFQAEILANSLVWDGTQLDYTSVGYDTTLTLFADESAPPQIDGTYIDFAPKKAYDSPYLEGEFGSGPVIISYGDDRTIHGVAPFAADANTVEHWDFETTLPGIHVDSTDSVQLISDGKFGGAVRCNFEAGDQYVMSAANWPANMGTFRYQGWIRLNPGDAGGYLYHVYDQVYLSVSASTVSFSINKSGVLGDSGADNVVGISADISAANEWQYIEAYYDGNTIKLVTEVETVSAPGIGPFAPNNGGVYIGSRKNTSNYVGDMDEVKVSSIVTTGPSVSDPVVLVTSAERFEGVASLTNTIAGFTPATGPNTKLVVCASWESGGGPITSVTYGGQSFTPAVSLDGGRHAAIWYLDEPLAASGDVVVQFDGNVRSRIGVLSLQNAAAGDPVQRALAGGSMTLNLFSPIENALSVGVYTENNGGPVFSSDFANTLYSGDSGSSLSHTGYQVEAVSGPKTYNWFATANSCAAVAASFAPVDSSLMDNHVPVADPQNVILNTNGSLAITLSGSDADSNSLTYTVVTPPANGSLSGTAPNLTYTPDVDFSGSDSFTFMVDDGSVSGLAVTVSITVEANSGPAIQVTEYYLSTGDFSGTTATLTLDQDLADDYYILVRGSRTGDGKSNPNNDYARIISVPGGKGELADSGAADAIGLQRQAADHDWEGVVTVVECQNSASASGFTLLDAKVTAMTSTSGTVATAAWSGINQVVLFGGYRGGGVEMFGAPTNRKQGTGCYTRLYPSGSDTLNWSRDAGGETMFDATMTTFVVEWGSDWTVQHVNVAGSIGGNGADATSEYTTAAINTVNRANTWVWATGTRGDSGIGDSAEGCLITLGDGVAQNATESTVAVGSEYSDAYDFDVYVMSHSGLAVDHRFKVDGDSTITDLAQTVDTASAGTRFAWVTNGCNGTGAAFPRPRLWARYTADGEVTISRGYSGQHFPAWIQGVDFSGVNGQ